MNHYKDLQLPVLALLNRYTEKSVVLLPSDRAEPVTIPWSSVHIQRLTAVADIVKVHDCRAPATMSADERADTMNTEVIAWVALDKAIEHKLPVMGPSL